MRYEDQPTKAKSRTHDEGPGRAIVFFDGGSVSRELDPSRELLIGRGDDADLVVPDESVSRRHAILWPGSPPRIEDAGSANGTLVDGVLVGVGTPVPLAPTSVVELGDALMVVRFTGPAAATDEPIAAATVPLDPGMAKVEELVELVAKSDIPVLLLGETGVGKGVVAEDIHRRAARSAAPFVRLNSAAFAETMLESELFGHERGAFTGATQAKPGLLESAEGGTVLLDEIGEMPLAVQAKLLHTLDHREVLRVGGLRPKRIDVRFLAATNRDLGAEVRRGRFREDLYFRLNGISITIPPLRERKNELVRLCRKFAVEAGGGEIGDAALTRLAAHDWPGNVRELRNVVLRAALFARGGKIGVEHLDLGAAPTPNRTGAEGLKGELKKLEAERIVSALDQSEHNQVRAAKLLGISRGTLRSRMKELGLLPDRGRSGTS